MRIIKSIFFSIFLLLLIAAGVFFIGREIVLTLGTSSMRSSLRQITTVAKNSGFYAAECRK